MSASGSGAREGQVALGFRQDFYEAQTRDEWEYLSPDPAYPWGTGKGAWLSLSLGGPDCQKKEFTGWASGWSRT